MEVHPFKASMPKTELITSPDSFFASIKHHYPEYRTNGIYQKKNKAGFYVYQIRTGSKKHTGLMTLTSVKELLNNKILKHEKTLAAKEQQMMHLLLQRKALVKPILLGYKSNDGIKAIIKKALRKKPMVQISFESNDEEHLIYAIEDEATVDQIVKHFKKVKKAYIGDGHHRSTTVALLSKSKELGPDAKRFSKLYTAYFPFDELEICDYNRVVDIADIISLPEFIVKLSHYFDMEPLKDRAKPTKKHQVTFFIAGKWYLMAWKKKFISKKASKDVLLDSALVNKHVFENILKIEDVRVDTRIKYYGGTQPLVKIENAALKREEGVGICIPPVSVKELTSIADKKKTLPPKSTWFLPRLKSGIIALDI